MALTERPAIPSAIAASARMLCVSLAFCVGLAACGGGSETATTDMSGGSTALSRAAEEAPGDTAPAAPSAHDQALIAQGARLSSAELLAAEQQADAPGAAQPRSAYASGQVMAKALATRIPVYRFYNGSTGAHFFTTSVAERDHVQANLSPPFSFEGPAFSVASAFSPGLSPVHRFFNTRSGVHFYTISESERAHVVANLPQFSYEGVAYHASQVAGSGLVPFYRFYVPSRGFHFYTASLGERDNIIANLGGTYSYEGVGYYVLDSDWRAPAVPHTGTTSSQCFQFGTVSGNANCSSVAVMDFNAQQDGHRVHTNPMNYSQVGGRPATQCVRDNVTGLTWEGKEVNGALRAGNLTFTNLGSGSASDASGYVEMVNTMGLCGFSDWRLPTRFELLTLVDYSRTVGVMINTTWFPNTSPLGSTWSADAVSTNTSQAWATSFEPGVGGYSHMGVRTVQRSIRLVRGSLPTGPRFSYNTVAHGTDGANNLVNDAWTGLQWRRCLEGAVWTGSTCTGMPTLFSHEGALAHARDQSGWRMPNIKEAASPLDLSLISGQRLNAVAFPPSLVGMVSQWTSTPMVPGGTAYSVTITSGEVRSDNRANTYVLRLVRSNP